MVTPTNNIPTISFPDIDRFSVFLREIRRLCFFVAASPLEHLNEMASECGISFVCRWRPVKTLPIAFLSALIDLLRHLIDYSCRRLATSLALKFQILGRGSVFGCFKLDALLLHSSYIPSLSLLLSVVEATIFANSVRSSLSQVAPDELNPLELSSSRYLLLFRTSSLEKYIACVRSGIMRKETKLIQILSAVCQISGTK